MNGIDMFLIHYGLIAVFLIMFIKTIGVPIPIPGDVIIFTAAVRVELRDASGRYGSGSAASRGGVCDGGKLSP